MAIPTSRTKKQALIKINEDLCIGCGLCVAVCKDFSIEMVNKKVHHSKNPVFGCIGCGHCMAICSTGAITIQGRELSVDDTFELNFSDNPANYKQLITLLEKRRSIREYKDENIKPEIIEKILYAARTAPMGLPPSDVNVLILDGRDKTRAFSKDFSEYLKGMKFMTSKIFLAMMRPFWGKENDELFRGFLKPLFRVYTEMFDAGDNYITYDAPLLMYFYATPYADPADPVVAATYAMLAAESLGLGTVMLGGIHPLIQVGGKSKKFRQNHNIKFKSREGLFVAFGYPNVKYRKGIKRTFASESFL